MTWGLLNLWVILHLLLVTTLKQVIYPLNLIEYVRLASNYVAFFFCEKLCELLNFNTILHTKIIYFVLRTIIHINYMCPYIIVAANYCTQKIQNSGSQLFIVTTLVPCNFIEYSISI
jgi:hypothetical protein